MKWIDSNCVPSIGSTDREDIDTSLQPKDFTSMSLIWYFSATGSEPKDVDLKQFSIDGINKGTYNTKVAAQYEGEYKVTFPKVGNSVGGWSSCIQMLGT